MSSFRSTLQDVSTSALQRLRLAIEGGTVDIPLTRSTLVSFGVRHQLEPLASSLTGHSRLACLAIIDVALAERAGHNTPAPELVWTGPEGPAATARDTAIVLRELFESAREHVILGGYSFTHAKRVLAPLHDVMKKHNVEATFFVDLKQPQRATQPPERHAEIALEKFLAKNWPFGPPTPALFYDTRAIVPPPPYSIVHAKCVVIDAKRAFISSANFTMQGQERNIEVGVLLDDAKFAQHLATQWMSLVTSGLVKRGSVS